MLETGGHPQRSDLRDRPFPPAEKPEVLIHRTAGSPPTLRRKFLHYSARYGLIHTLSSYVGRSSPRFWRLVGPVVTAPYRHRWAEKDGPKILNLGGGSNCLPECLTADIDPRADVYLDIRKPFPFGDRSLDGIFCEEVIEHFTLDVARSILRECHRTLRPGKPLRIITPDLAHFARLVVDGEPQASTLINSVFLDHEHRHLFLAAELTDVCREIGFSSIRQSRYRDLSSSLGGLDSHPERFNHPPEFSIYIEASTA